MRQSVLLSCSFATLASLFSFNSVTLAAAPTLTPAHQLELAVIDAQDHRLPAAPALAEALTRREPRLRALAALAFGRIQAPATATQVEPLLSDRVAKVRAAAAFALGMIGGDSALAALRPRLATERNHRVRAQLLQAIGRTGDATDVALLSASLATDPAGAAEGLGFLFGRSAKTVAVPAATLTKLLTQAQGDAGAVEAGFALVSFPGDPTTIGDVAGAFAKAPNAPARMQLAGVLGKLPGDTTLTTLLAGAEDPVIGVRVEVQRALGVFPASPKTLAALQAGLADPASQVVDQALTSIAALGTAASSLSSPLQSLVASSPSTWLAGIALETLAAVDPTAAHALATQTLATDSTLLVNALHVLGIVGGEDSLKALLPYLTSTDRKTATAAADALDNNIDLTLLAQDAKPALRAALATDDLAMVGDVSDIAGRGAWTDFADDLAAAYRAMTSPDDVEGKMAILGALGKIGDKTQVPLVLSAMQDNDRVVIVAAAAAYRQLTGLDLSSQIPINSKVVAVTPPLAEIKAAAAASVVLTTARGRVVLKMLGVAPLSSYTFVKLAKSGFYDGLTFHRVVPNFVVQGGDPRGDGYGGPGFLIRDEVSPVEHRRGAVGIATAGKDTGGCQLFIDHDPNLYLDGAYTVFAEVVEGMDVVDRLEQGDVITSAVVQ